MKLTRQNKTSIGRNATLAVLVAMAMVASFAFAAQAQAEESEADITVEFHEDDMGFNVTSSKDLSNVIVEPCPPAVPHKHEDFGENQTNWTHRENFTIAGVWVKSGSFMDPEGPPGAGERFDNEGVDCVPPQEPCDGPADVSAVPTPDGIQVNWTAVEDADNYTIYRKTGDGNFSIRAHVDSTTTGFLDTEVEPGLAYTYRVTATIDGDETDHCDEATATAIPVFPTIVAGGLAALVGIGAYAVARRR